MYRKLKELMLTIGKKLSQNYKSKKNIIYMTTTIRAFQLVMDHAIAHRKVLIAQSETIILFTALYKLVFLGTQFASRVLQIQVEPKKDEKVQIIDSASEVSSSDQDGAAT
jgi:hypothetical protein